MSAEPEPRAEPHVREVPSGGAQRHEVSGRLLDNVERIWRGIMVKAGTPKPIVDTLITAQDQMKQTQEWKDFSRINMQSSMEISLDGMQKLVANEIASDRAFLESSGFLK